MVLNAIFCLYVILVTVSSIWLGQAVHTGLLMMSACLFMLSLVAEFWTPRLRYLQIVTLALFHWSSQLNWCQPIYMLLAFKECYRIHNLKRSFIIAVLFASIYSTIRINYLPDTIYNILVTFFDLMNFMIIMLAIYYIVKMEKEKRLLSKEKHRLSTRDPLTGLLNYQEYHKQLSTLLKKEKRFVLLLIDCTDLKSMNDELGYHSGNQILIKIANYLRDTFADAYIVAHYGGDEFAVAIKVENEKQVIPQLTNLLDGRLAKELKVNVTYGYAVYPYDGNTKDTLVSTAEQKLFAMKRDIWLKREEQKIRAEKLKLVGELAAGIAHEIRNPLTTVKGFLQLSKENNYNIEPWYDLVMGEATRVSELTAEFVQFSKPHTTQFKVQPLIECIQRVVSLTKSEAAYLGHEIRCERMDAAILARIDKDKLVQLMINLIRNAFDAMNKAGVVTIRLYRDGDKATIEVEDTGEGIPESQLNKIFNPFYTTKETGAGLGLSICHQIMQVHSGIIEVESIEDVGTCFHLSLPLVREALQDEQLQTV